MPIREGKGVLEEGAPSVLGAHPVAQALLHDAGCAVALLDEHGTVLACNGALAGLLGGGSPGDLRASPIDKWFDADTAQAHRQARRTVLSRGSPAAVEGMVGLMSARATYRRINAAERPLLLLVLSRWWPDQPPVPEDAEGAYNHPDPRTLLTPRELEVLAAIGRGLSTAEIADQLHRSPKTIEGHRVSLGIKLGATNRVQLARIAIRAGLAPLSGQFIDPKPVMHNGAASAGAEERA